MKRLKNIPHLFAKVTVIYCILCATAASVYAMRAQAAGMSMEGVLVAVLGFFGGELLFLCLKTILAAQQRNDSAAQPAGICGPKKEESDDES